MAYADPQSTSNPTTGQPILAAWGDVVRDDLEYLARNKPHCRVYKSTATSIATATATALTFNSERYDVGGCHSTSSNTGRLTVPSGEAGKYLAGFHGSWDVNGTGYRQAYIRLNGTTIIGVDTKMAVTGAGTEHSVVTEYALVAGDYLEVVVTQTSGGALNMESASAYSPEFWFRWVAI